jgi:hypothetical protein
MITFAAYITYSDGLTMLIGRYDTRAAAQIGVAEFVKDRKSYTYTTQIVKVPTYFFGR